MILLLNNNLIKKIIGMNIMDTSIFLLFISLGNIEGKEAPIIVGGKMSTSGYINPVSYTHLDVYKRQRWG